MNSKENPFNWVRICGYLIFLMIFGSYFENIFDQSALYLIMLTLSTMVATKIILLIEEMVLTNEDDAQ